MLEMTRDLHKVLNYSRRWGIEIRLVSYMDEMPTGDQYNWFKSPLCHGGIEWDERRIWLLDGKARYPSYGPFATPNILLHELAHCLAFENPEEISEPYSEMLAFEYYSTRWLRLGGWSKWMHDYYLDRDDGFSQARWSDTTTRERHRWLEASLTAARFYGVLNKDGTPTFRRDHGTHS